MYTIIRAPVITEKATLLSEKHTRWSSVWRSTRPSPRSRPRSKGLFGVTVMGVNTLVTKGKTKRFKGRPGCART